MLKKKVFFGGKTPRPGFQISNDWQNAKVFRGSGSGRSPYDDALIDPAQVAPG